MIQTLNNGRVTKESFASVVDVDNADRTGTIKGVYAELSQAALAKSGTLRAQFKITSGEQILRTEIFQVKNGIALDGETSEWADQYEGYNLDELVQSVNSAVAAVTEIETDVSELNEDLSAIMANNLQAHGIKLAFGETVKEVVGKTKVEKIITDKASYNVDMVILAVGFRPNTSLAAGKVELFKNGAFLVDKKQETSLPGVYAIGDCATIYNNASREIDYIALASNAVRTGIVAAHNACGHNLEGIGAQGSNGISIYGLNMLSTGLTLEKAKAKGFDAEEVEYSDNTTFLNYVNFPPAVEDSYDDIVSSQASGKQADPTDEGILIATTRPELMSACVAVVIHPEDERYTHLLGKYVEVPLSHQKVKIIADEEVDPEFGTGAVMICTFGDKTDVSWVQKYDLEIINAIDETGTLTAASGRYEGMDLQTCKKQTIEDLKAEGYLLKQEQVDQNVGQCWRCKTPIEILVKKQWFVAVRDLI